MSAPSSTSSATSRKRFVGVGGIHLIAAAVAKLRRAFRRFAKRSVKGGGKFCRVTHDAGLVEAGGVERLADGADAAVHHVARRDDVGAGGGVRERGFHEQLDLSSFRTWKWSPSSPRHAAMAMAHVFAETDIGDDDQLGTFALIARTACCTTPFSA